MPALTASGNNINFIIGTCINVASSGQAFAPPPMPQARLKQENTVTFSDKELEFSANNNQKINRVSIWDMESKSKVAEYGSTSNTEIHKISTEGLKPGKQYLIQIETEEGFYNKVYEYLE